MLSLPLLVYGGPEDRQELSAAVAQPAHRETVTWGWWRWVARMERAAHASGHLAGLLAAQCSLCSLHLLKSGRVQLIRPKRSREVALSFGEFGLVLPCFAHQGDCSSCSSYLLARREEGWSPARPWLWRGQWRACIHRPGAGRALGHGTAEKQPSGEGNSRYVQLQGKHRSQRC